MTPWLLAPCRMGAVMPFVRSGRARRPSVIRCGRSGATGGAERQADRGHVQRWGVAGSCRRREDLCQTIFEEAAAIVLYRCWPIWSSSCILVFIAFVAVGGLLTIKWPRAW